MNKTKFDVTFVGPGSELVGPGALDHKNTLFARKKIVFPEGRLDGSEGSIEIQDSSCWGRKVCVAVVYANRIRKQRSLTTFGKLREVLKKEPLNAPPDDTQWNSFPHLFSTSFVAPVA